MNQRKLFIYISSLLFAIFLSINVHGNDNIEINGDGNVNGDDNINGDDNRICRDNSICIDSPNDANEDLSGVWEQYSADRYGNLIYVGEFLVTKQNGAFIMVPREQVQAPGIINAVSISDVTYNEKFWTFKSHWGNGMFAKFRLERVSSETFEGVSLVNGQIIGRDRWIKIEYLINSITKQ